MSDDKDTNTEIEQTGYVDPFFESQTVPGRHLNSLMSLQTSNRIVGNVDTNMGYPPDGTPANGFEYTTDNEVVKDALHEATSTASNGPFKDVFIEIIEIASIEPREAGYLGHSGNRNVSSETIENAFSTIGQNVTTGTMEDVSSHVPPGSTPKETTESASNGTIEDAPAVNEKNTHNDTSRHPYVIWLERHWQPDRVTAPAYAECKAIASSLGKDPGTTYHQITEHESAETGTLTAAWYGRNKWIILAGGQPKYVNEEEREQMRMWYKRLKGVDAKQG
jgi:hypothetical protein